MTLRATRLPKAWTVFVAAIALLGCDDGTGSAPGEVAGVVREDDTGVADVEITLQGVGVQMTDANGRFLFTGVSPGTYTISVAIPEGKSLSSSDDAQREVSVRPNETTEVGWTFDPCAPGAVRSGTLDCTGWEAGLHVIEDTVSVKTLTIASGAVVCGRAGALLQIEDALVANDVRFTACDTAEAWGGIQVGLDPGASRTDWPPTSYLTNVTIEYAHAGIWGSDLVIQNSIIRQTRGTGIRGGAVVSNTRVDTTAINGGAGIMADPWYGMTLSDVQVMGSGGTGVASNRAATLTLTNVAIQGSAGVGLNLHNWCWANGGPSSFSFEGRLRLTGNLYPAAISSHNVAALLPTPAAHDSLLGNQRDTLLVGASYLAAPATVRAVLPWKMSGHCGGNGRMNGLVMEPGASLAPWSDPLLGVAILEFTEATRLEGTSTDPIRFIGLEIHFDGTPSDTSFVRHARLESGAQIIVHPGHIVVFEDVVESNGKIRPP